METIINKTQKKDILMVDPRLLRIEEGFNTRIDYGEIEELVNSIIENGVKVPLRGYKDGEYYVINDGHRRLRATMIAIENGNEVARVPFITEHKKTMEERILDILITNDGKPLTPLELGETYKRLINFGYNFSDIAKRVGKTVKHVSDMVLVAESSRDVKALISDGQISATLVAEIKSKVKDVDASEEIIKKASENKQGGKITKKDIAEIKSTKLTFTREELTLLLHEQILACAETVSDPQIKEQILNTEMVSLDEF